VVVCGNQQIPLADLHVAGTKAGVLAPVLAFERATGIATSLSTPHDCARAN
jgi:hypothetical protein